MPTETAYPENDDRRRLRENAFTYHAPKGDQAARYTQIRSAGGELAQLLNTRCPPSRELSLALTKIEEAIFWANAAIARNE